MRPFLPLALRSVPLLLSAEVRMRTDLGEYRMGNGNTREDAVGLAMEPSKRNVLGDEGARPLS